MSIYAYTGLPGCGKSYNAVEQVILPALKAGRKVVTNVPLYVDRIREVVTTGELVEFPVSAVAQQPDTIKDYVTPGCVFVLDEVWRLWPAGQKTDEVPEAFKSLLAEHRHMVDAEGNSVAITLLVQDLANIGSFARRLVEQTFIHTKLGHVGLSGRFRVDIFQGQVTGVTGPIKKRLREIYGNYKPEVWKFYKSHTMSEAKSDGGKEKHVDSRGNVLKKPILIVGALAIPCLIAFGVYGLSNFIHGPAAKASSPGSVSQSHSAGPSTNPVSMMSSKPQSPSTAAPSWRVVGWVLNQEKPDMSKAMMVSSGGQHYTVEFQECRRIVGQPLQCLLEGFWYSETGRTWPDEGVHGPIFLAQPVGANNVSTG